jgi:hypothetical protein
MRRFGGCCPVIAVLFTTACGPSAGDLCNEAVAHVQSCGAQDVVTFPVCGETEQQAAADILTQDCEGLSGRSASSTWSWTKGTLAASAVVPEAVLQPILTRPAGPPIWKSNNPEIILGSGGWLMQNSRSDSRRGGRRSSLNGAADLYLFHINKSSGPRHLHVLLSNGGTAAMTAGIRGSLYTSVEKPFAASGPSYAVASDWLLGKPRTVKNALVVPPNAVIQLASASLPVGVMVDGRFELQGLASAYLYTMVTMTGKVEDAIDLSQGSPVQGEIRSPSTKTFGREAGVYGGSRRTATLAVAVPPGPAYLGLALNATSKFDPAIPDCTSPALMSLADSAPRTFGNYGHRYDVKIQLRGAAGSTRRVRVWFASSATEAEVSATYHGPMRVNGTVVTVRTTPQQPRTALGTFNVPPAGMWLALSFYVPGLITVGQQIVLESI